MNFIISSSKQNHIVLPLQAHRKSKILEPRFMKNLLKLNSVIFEGEMLIRKKKKKEKKL